MTLLLANGFGRHLAVLNSGPQAKNAYPHGQTDHGGERTSEADIRRYILKQRGYNNVLEGLQLTWTLTAFNLMLLDGWVIHLGAEHAI